MLTIRQAADLAGCDPSTVKRDLLDGRYPQATRDETDRNRAWRIPVEDLVVAGRYRPAVTAAAVLDAADRDRRLTEVLQELQAEREAHAATVGLLAVAQASLEAERRQTAMLERLVDRALGSAAGTAQATGQVAR